MPVKHRFAALLHDITALRCDLHEHPAILFDTHRTPALVAEKLRQFGSDDLVTGIGRTGVVDGDRKATAGGDLTERFRTPATRAKRPATRPAPPASCV